MEIAAVVKCSFVDYPSKIAAVVFAPGCNLNCGYCHNRALLTRNNLTARIAPETVLWWLQGRATLLDAVVVSGGEPTLQSGLAGFVAEVRALGYLVKLDTNGTHPTVLAALLEAGLLDYVAMDIKAPSEKYDAVCGVPVDQRAIDESIALLMDGRVDYEFRTTIVPQLTREDILVIGNRIRGANSYFLQRYRERQSAKGLNNSYWAPVSEAPRWFENVRQRLGLMVKTCHTRGF